MKGVIMIRVKMDQETLTQLDRTGKKLKIFTYNVPNLIRALCGRSLEMFNDFKELTDTLLEFLDQNELGNTKIAQKTLTICQKYFNNK